MPEKPDTRTGISTIPELLDALERLRIDEGPDGMAESDDERELDILRDIADLADGGFETKVQQITEALAWVTRSEPAPWNTRSARVDRPTVSSAYFISEKLMDAARALVADAVDQGSIADDFREWSVQP